MARVAAVAAGLRKSCDEKHLVPSTGHWRINVPMDTAPIEILAPLPSKGLNSVPASNRCVHSGSSSAARFSRAVAPSLTFIRRHADRLRLYSPLACYKKDEF
jgi:hypothetical protein